MSYQPLLLFLIPIYEMKAVVVCIPLFLITLHSTGGVVVDEMLAMNYHIENMRVVGLRATCGDGDLGR
jgi:hypothetical protein